MMREYTAKEESSVYIYVSNENPIVAEVYFDDFKIKHVKSPVLQYNEYYPYGLQTATSWTRENATGNSFLYNGGTELNGTTQVYDLHYRNYDPALGRMNQVDPVASKYASQTPYNYAFNTPTVMNDPLGDDPMFDREAWRGGANRATYYNRPKDGGSLAFGSHKAEDRGYRTNMAFMFTREFIDYYGINNDQARFDAGRAMGTAVNIHAVQDGQIGWETYIGLGAANTAWFINGKLIDVTRKGAAFFSADFSQNGNGIWSLEYKEKWLGDGRGSAESFSFGFAFGFGMSGEWGTVRDETGASKGYYTISANFGLGLDIGFNKKEIIPTNGSRFRVDQYQGFGKNLSMGAFFTSESRGGNYPTQTINPFDMGTNYKERSNAYSPFLGIPVGFGLGDVGVLYQMGKTEFYK